MNIDDPAQANALPRPTPCLNVDDQTRHVSPVAPTHAQVPGGGEPWRTGLGPHEKGGGIAPIVAIPRPPWRVLGVPGKGPGEACRGAYGSSWAAGDPVVEFRHYCSWGLGEIREFSAKLAISSRLSPFSSTPRLISVEPQPSQLLLPSPSSISDTGAP